jgi:hypothetical protein
MKLLLILFFTSAACDNTNYGVTTPCSRDAQCGAGLHCVGASRWCTRSCTSDADCGGDHCMAYSLSGAAVCFPTCDGDESKCSHYGSGVSCQSMHNVSGSLVQVCSE